MLTNDSAVPSSQIIEESKENSSIDEEEQNESEDQ
jgi:hypothetical protein